MTPQPAVTRVQRALTTEQASTMIGSPVEWREPDLTEPTIAADATTGEPAFAYLPVGPVTELRRAVLGFDYEIGRAHV